MALNQDFQANYRSHLLVEYLFSIESCRSLMQLHILTEYHKTYNMKWDQAPNLEVLYCKALELDTGEYILVDEKNSLLVFTRPFKNIQKLSAAIVARNTNSNTSIICLERATKYSSSHL